MSVFDPDAPRKKLLPVDACPRCAHEKMVYEILCAACHRAQLGRRTLRPEPVRRERRAL